MWDRNGPVSPPRMSLRHLELESIRPAAGHAEENG